MAENLQSKSNDNVNSVFNFVHSFFIFAELLYLYNIFINGSLSLLPSILFRVDQSDGSEDSENIRRKKKKKEKKRQRFLSRFLSKYHN